MLSLLEINRILQDEDVEGLLHSGAPEDEYYSEAEDIAAALRLLSADQFSEDSVFSIISLI